MSGILKDLTDLCLEHPDMVSPKTDHDGNQYCPIYWGHRQKLCKYVSNEKIERLDYNICTRNKNEQGEFYPEK